MGLLLVTLYQSIKNRKVYLTRIFFMIAIDFIVNQLYDTKKFYDLFHVNLKEAGIVVALVIVGGILISTSIKEIHKLLIYIQNGIKKCIESEKQEEKKLQGKKINFRRSIAKNIRGENLENVLEKENASAKDKVNSKEKETEKGEQIDKLNVRAFYIILSTILLTTIIFLIYSLKGNLLDVYQNVDTIGLLNIIISVISLIIFLMFVCTVVIGIILKLVFTLYDIWINRDQKSYYLIYAGVFILLSLYVSKQFGLKIDDVADAIVNGNIFSFPLILVIILPVFFMFLDNFQKYMKESPHIKNEIVNLIHTTAFDIVISLLKYIRFITADFLSSVSEIVEEDIENDGSEERIESCDKREGEETESSN